MMKVRQVREWLDALDNESEVAIDDGGLMLMLVLVDNPDVYLEVGGVPPEYEEKA